MSGDDRSDDEGDVSVRSLRRLGQGRAAEVFEWDPGRVVRLLRRPGAGGQLEREAAAMHAAERGSVPVPRVHEIVELDGRQGVVLDRVDGPDLLAHMSRRPHKLRWAARLLARSHAALLAVEGPPELPSLVDTLPAQLSQSPLVPHALAERAAGLIADLAPGQQLLHGDFHPGNVLLGQAGAVIIDWTGAARGPALADVATTRILLSVGEPPPGTGPALRALIATMRRLFLRTYEAELPRHIPVDHQALRAWTAVMAIDRLREGIESERTALLALAEAMP